MRDFLKIAMGKWDPIPAFHGIELRVFVNYVGHNFPVEILRKSRITFVYENG